MALYDELIQKASIKKIYEIPVLVGIDEVYHNRGWIQMPETPPDEGFHACLVVGYNDNNEHFIVRKSWGPDRVC